jgi:DNA-binding NarL/FixJ family response regulator
MLHRNAIEHIRNMVNSINFLLMTPTIDIALVDDHTLFRLGLKSLIEKMPNHRVVIEAPNGEEYIEMVKANPLPHTVLLDIDMPKKDGYATAKWIQEERPDIKVLVLSTMDAELAVIRMLRVGAKGYLLKDADPCELKEAFHQVQTQGFHTNNIVSRTVMNNIPEIMNQKSSMARNWQLNERELTFLTLACTDKPYKEIADDMNLSERTIDGYREALFQKFNVRSRVGLAIYAIKNNVVTL